ncbi:hypothetical protein HZB00_03935 [Candidatus Woesearchaeota archaeon]|nr:hypothetical protein [Candidatus Woesearchaeota archaeon]
MKNIATIFIIIFIIILLLSGGAYLFLGKKSANTPTGNAVITARGDIFSGKISNKAVEPGIINGFGVYDKSCIMGNDGLTSCDAGIQTKEYGLLNFKYRHNMQQEPCIAPKDALLVKILDSEGNAQVQKEY